MTECLQGRSDPGDNWLGGQQRITPAWAEGSQQSAGQHYEDEDGDTEEDENEDDEDGSDSKGESDKDGLEADQDMQDYQPEDKHAAGGSAPGHNGRGTAVRSRFRL